ncbi:MAG: hypothetical protein K0R46_377 [Herbinix sp.]|nr:hypothetical protein [Herbinix sp.]
MPDNVFKQITDHTIILLQSTIWGFFIHDVMKTRKTLQLIVFFVINLEIKNLMLYLTDNQAIIGFFNITSVLMTYVIVFCVVHGQILQSFIWNTICIIMIAIAEEIVMLSIVGIKRVPINEIYENEVLYFVLACIACLVTYLLLRVIVRGRRKELHLPKTGKMELILLAAVNIVSIVAGVIMVNNDKWVIENASFLIYAILLLVLVISIITIILIYKISDQSQKHLEAELRLQQYEMSGKLNEDMVSVVERLRALRHDLNNHIGIIKGFAQMQEYDSLNEYIDDIYTDLKSANELVFSNSVTLSTILNTKISLASKKKIELDAILTVNDIKMSDSDLCVLLGNMLDNAIEATDKVEENRYIQLKIYEKDHGCQIECSNPYKEKPIMVNGMFLTSKRESLEHGIGFSNIKAVVNKCNGKLRVNTDQLFELVVHIPYDLPK